MPSVQAIRCPQKSPSGSSAATAWWTDDDGCFPWFSGVAVRRTRFWNDSSKDRGTASSTEETALLTTLHVLFLRIPTASGPVGRGIGLSACLDQCAWGVSDCEGELFGGTKAGSAQEAVWTEQLDSLHPPGIWRRRFFHGRFWCQKGQRRYTCLGSQQSRASGALWSW